MYRRARYFSSVPFSARVHRADRRPILLMGPRYRSDGLSNLLHTVRTFPISWSRPRCPIQPAAREHRYSASVPRFHLPRAEPPVFRAAVPETPDRAAGPRTAGRGEIRGTGRRGERERRVGGIAGVGNRLVKSKPIVAGSRYRSLIFSGTV